LCNFGGFATPERRVLFSINDLDETHPAPWECDVKRLAPRGTPRLNRSTVRQTGAHWLRRAAVTRAYESRAQVGSQC
jgi:hypothetical protein